MTVVQTTTFSVTHVDVLYVVQQIKRDLVAFSEAYPKLLSVKRVLDLHDAMVTFISNDAVTRIGFSIQDPTQSNLVFHELRYEISYTGTGGRVGIGGSVIERLHVPRMATMTPWVVWSATMLALSPAQQRQILQGTGWEVSGDRATKNRFNPRYTTGSFATRSTYSSGILSAQSQEYK